MRGTLLLACCIWWGSGLVRASGVGRTPEERWTISVISGLVTGTALIYLVAAAAAGLSGAVLVSSAVIMLAGGHFARRLAVVKLGWPARWFVLTMGALGAVLLFFNLRGILATDASGALIAAEHIWADMPFHTSIITSFAHRANIPPMYPLALGKPLAYPFFVDFLSAAMMRSGLGLRAAIIAPNLLIHLTFFGGVSCIAARLGGRRAAILAPVVLCLLGNFGFVAAVGDMASAGGFWRWIQQLPWSYTGDALGTPGRDRLGTGLYLGNPTFMFLLPRRSGAFGLATGVALLLLLDDLRTPREGKDVRRWGTAVMAGVLLGLLPRVHAHTAIAMAFVGGCWILAGPRRQAGRLKGWILTGAIALVVAIPQLAVAADQASGFFSAWLGWTGEPHDAFTAVVADPSIIGLFRAFAILVRFWILNGGMLIFLILPALLFGPRKIRSFLLPFGLIWLFGNLVRTSPWEWDNSNHFVWWQIGTTIAVCSWLAAAFGRRATTEDGRSPSAFSRRMLQVGGVISVVLLTLGGLLSLEFSAQRRMPLWSEGDRRIAAWVRSHTPQNAAILTSNGHTHPVIGLSGRQTFMGFAGWFVAQGLGWQEYEQRLTRMYAGDVRLMHHLGITHVVIGPWEEGYAVEKGIAIPPSMRNGTGGFRVVYRSNIDGRPWTILRVD